MTNDDDCREAAISSGAVPDEAKPLTGRCIAAFNWIDGCGKLSRLVLSTPHSEIVKMDESPDKPKQSSSRKRWILLIVIALATLLAIAVTMPWIAASTPLRNWVIGQLVADPDAEVTAEGASFGWFSPLELEGLKILRRDGKTRIGIERVCAEDSWFQLLLALPKLGSFEVDRPQIQVTLPLTSDPTTTEEVPGTPASMTDKATTFTATVREAGLKVYAVPQDNALIDLQNISFAVSIEGEPNDRELVIDSTRLLDRQTLSPELCNQGLQLIAPFLAESTEVEGEVSLELNEFRLPLDAVDPQRHDERTSIQGSVQLHQVSAGLRGPLMDAIGGLLGTLLRTEIPNRIRMADDTVVAFHVRQGRVHHEGLSLLLPELPEEIVLKTRGSVGLDNTLDLIVEVPIPLTLLHDGPLMQRLSRKPLELHVTGTLAEPQVNLPPGESVLQNVTELLLEEDPETGAPPLAETIMDAVGDLIERRRQAQEEGQTATPLLDRLRERRQMRLRPNAANGEDGSTQTPPRRGLLRRN